MVLERGLQPFQLKWLEFHSRSLYSDLALLSASTEAVLSWTILTAAFETDADIVARSGPDICRRLSDGAADAKKTNVRSPSMSASFHRTFSVTNDECARFVRRPDIRPRGARSSPDHDRAREAGFAKARRRTSGKGISRRGSRRSPVVLVRYDDALAYCHWLSEAISGPCACRRKLNGRRRRVRTSRSFAIH
jgi:hypothetical protein